MLVLSFTYYLKPITPSHIHTLSSLWVSCLGNYSACLGSYNRKLCDWIMSKDAWVLILWRCCGTEEILGYDYTLYIKIQRLPWVILAGPIYSLGSQSRDYSDTTLEGNLDPCNAGSLQNWSYKTQGNALHPSLQKNTINSLTPVQWNSLQTSPFYNCGERNLDCFELPCWW